MKTLITAQKSAFCPRNGTFPRQLYAALSIIAIIVPSAYSATVVVPSTNESLEGNSNTVGGFFTEVPGFPGSNTTGHRMQQVYSSNQFAEALLITEIRFRPDGGPAGVGFTTNIPNFIARMSTTSAAPDGLSSTFSNNYGNDLITIFSGTLSLSSNNTILQNGTKEFDIVLAFQSPFIYDPAKGNLLIEYINPNSLSGSGLDAQFVSGDSISRIISEDPAANNAQFVDSVGLITQIVGTSVPEPNTFALLIAATLGSLVLRQRTPANKAAHKTRHSNRH